MSTRTEVPSTEPIVTMSRVYEAPRDLVWKAMTEPHHIVRWWGGAGVDNPVCEMDVRPGGAWRHVMRFPNGVELRLDFVFVEVVAPERLVWKHVDHDARKQDGPPTSVTTVTLEDLGAKTRWSMTARFHSLADRDQAIGMGFTKPIEASSESLIAYLPTMGTAR